MRKPRSDGAPFNAPQRRMDHQAVLRVYPPELSDKLGGRFSWKNPGPPARVEFVGTLALSQPHQPSPTATLLHLNLVDPSGRTLLF